MSKDIEKLAEIGERIIRGYLIQSITFMGDILEPLRCVSELKIESEEERKIYSNACWSFKQHIDTYEMFQKMGYEGGLDLSEEDGIFDTFKEVYYSKMSGR